MVRATIDAEACRKARAALGWRPDRLAGMAGISAGPIYRLERGQAVTPRIAATIRQAFEAAGVEFIAHADYGLDVRLRKYAEH